MQKKKLLREKHLPHEGESGLIIGLLGLSPPREPHQHKKKEPAGEAFLIITTLAGHIRANVAALKSLKKKRAYNDRKPTRLQSSPPGHLFFVFGWPLPRELSLPARMLGRPRGWGKLVHERCRR